ncbi:alpha/beta hydrolase [Virgibacillus kekensis]|uniref:Alpha/beta hydrolase n=1 Tax=Virgibacillus kekensis TaxID=202261 RepID=A0ABV9DG88_9BACI
MIEQTNALLTIQKSLLAARLFDGFWDRWIAHGILFSETAGVRNCLKNVTKWEDSFRNTADQHYEQATLYQRTGAVRTAEELYRLSSLYYNLIHWIYPDRTIEKIDWLKKATEATERADLLSAIPRVRESVTVDGFKCPGRIRVPASPKGCIFIINPIDSTKEELYTYEIQFVEADYITVSFDGPGQGEAFTLNGLTATTKRWEQFLGKVIDLTHDMFPDLPIHLFGTSSGASWAIHGSLNPKVYSSVAVSPPLASNGPMPHYFGERINFISSEGAIVSPITKRSDYPSVLLFHGAKDVMVNTADIHDFYQRLPEPKQLVEYSDEGHCCNFKLEEVRRLAVEWFSSKGERKRDAI